MHHANLLLYLTSILLCISITSQYKILGLFPFGSPSHYFLGNELMKGLAEAGHDATIITVFEEKNPPKNGKYRQILLDGLLEEQQAIFAPLTNMSNKDSGAGFNNPLLVLSIINKMGVNVTESVLAHSKTQHLLKSKEKFDVVIVSQFNLDALKALAPRFGAHQVIFNNNAASSWMNHFVGNPNLPSINPEMILGYPALMNFQQRLINTIVASVNYINNNLINYPTLNKLVHKYISEEYDLEKVLYNVSLVLSNSHSSLNKASSLVPCMKEIGGFHVKPPKKLPEDLQKYLDGAKNGVIYFSMGSNFKSASLPASKKEALMKAFSKRKEDILWKFEDDQMPGKPKNVKLEKWLPQSDLLAHPNIKLFITHGGFLSTIETVYHGVPTVAMPIGGDQLQNAQQAEMNGYAKMVEFNTLTEESMSAAIEEVLSNKKYRENVKERSKIFHDRQVKPLDEAIYWIEYTVRHNGAKHLRVGYLDLTWYQYYLLDVFGFIFGVIFTTIAITIIVLRWCIRRIFKKKDTVPKLSKKLKKQ